ncbi:kunitz-type trypsin inhibitor-like 2 protein [Lotus japonicus]|uniref:kunitz-type trypsin inhibitor-like 2 protein n=1 Tax=Lotus japonicus TaxID=34305 RepID=UPI00258F89E6|nr:kunitz-type trypsin inhibitor-like 2 protein [Lotus japonicus]
MKPAILLALSFLLFALTTNIPLAFSQDDHENVLDTGGRELIGIGPGYYIMPAFFGAAGGGVWPGETGNQTCPVTVLQDYSEVVSGKPVKFYTGTRPGYVYTGAPLDIVFGENPECTEYSSKWVFVYDDFPKAWVGIGGVEDHPGKDILSGKFKIEKYGDFGYKLVFCPKFTAPPGACFDIGRFDDEKGRRLVHAEEGDRPFEVVFVRAIDDSGIRSID